ncbi:MAG: NAD(P)H-dependent oxidoreductase [Anaerolineae bacterium]|nr:NAD(P)H-dependent oxidoreductase [Anaerolineae bacterium]
MQLSVILAHPQPQSFNHAITQAAVTTLQQNGHEIFFTIHPVSSPLTGSRPPWSPGPVAPGE